MMKCPNCKSEKVVKRGKTKLKIVFMTPQPPFPFKTTIKPLPSQKTPDFSSKIPHLKKKLLSVSSDVFHGNQFLRGRMIVSGCKVIKPALFAFHAVLFKNFINSQDLFFVHPSY